MDMTTNYHSLAKILASLVESKEKGEELPLANHVARQLSTSQDGGEKAVLAEMLVALLSKPQNGYAENILTDFVKDLVVSAAGSPEEVAHKSLQICSRIALSVPAILSELTKETKKVISGLLLAASNSHVASDDAFEPNLRLFPEKYCSFTIREGHKSQDSDLFESLYNTITQYLKLLKIILLTETNTPEPTETLVDINPLVPIIFSLIALKNKKIAELSCHVLRLLLGKLDLVLPQETSEMVWYGIQTLLKAPTHVDLAFNIWLRWVSLSGMGSRPQQSMLQQENYWSLLQSGLSTGFNERRKLCLCILNSSLRLASKPINNTVLKYDSSSLKDSIAWAKYSTMIEIISLSTSTNQFLAAVPDARRLLSPYSPIYGSWIVVLMTLGLTSSCGPLQKAAWEFLLTLDGIELGKLLEEERGRNFINDIFLPYSIAAHHFSVQRRKDSRCEYGEKLAGFLKKATVQSQDPTRLLEFVETRQDAIFAPARVYVLKGIMDGATELSSGDLGVEDIGIIVKISKMKRFALLKTDICISMCFKLLLLVNLDRVTFEIFFDTLTEIFSGKEHLITVNFVKLLRKFFATREKVNRHPQFLLLKLEDALRACTTEGTPSRMFFRAVILIALIDKKGKVLGKALDTLSTDKDRFRLLSLLFSSTWLAEEILQDPETRIVLTVKLEKVINSHPGNFLKDGYTTELAALLYHQRAHRFLNYLNKETLITLFKHAWDLVHKQCLAKTRQTHLGQIQEVCNDGFDLEAEKLAGELLVVCDATGLALSEAKPLTFIGKDQILGLIMVVPLPVLDQNKHENMLKLKTIGRFLYSAYGLLNSLIGQLPEKELGEEFVDSLFDTSRRMLRYIDKGSLLRILGCFRTVFYRAPTAVESYSKLGPLVRDLWDCIDVTRAVAEESLLEVDLIKTIFDISIIRASLGTNKALAVILPEVGKEIMKLSRGKRSLAPAFASKLREAYLSDPEIFCSCKWVVDVFIELINHAPSKDPEFLVENSVANIFDEVCSEPNHYEKYYNEKEEMAQVYIFDVLSRLDPSNPSESALVDCLRDKIYGPWTLNKPGIPVYSKWKKASQLQVLLVLERFVIAEKSALFLATTILTLCNEPHPRYRFLLEWMAALCIIRFPENRGCLWEHLQAPPNPNPKLQASLLRVAIMVARELQEDLKEGFYTELLYTVIPLSSNNKVAVRHQATSMVLELWDDLVQWQHLRDNVVLQRLRQSILNSEFFKQVIAAGKMENEKTFDARSNYTLAGILSGNYLLGGDEADLISPELFSALKPHDLKKSFILIGSADQFEGSNKVEFTKTEETALLEAPLQTKSGGWDAKALIEANEHRKSKVSSSKGGLEIILIASLIENAYNLGGLSRVSEIMGVNTLCFNSKDVLKLKDFTSVSVSSEVWLPILEVKAADILEYIRAKKLEGYSVVGIEQTDRSVILGKGDYGLLKKVVLLLGSEKYGIPAELLAELDLCVEIPQKGETRSMNVQTAAAVVLYEFCRQFG